MKKRTLFINLCFDGLGGTLHCGAGSFNQNMRECIGRINNSSEEQIVPYFFSPDVSQQLPYFDSHLLKSNQEFCSQHGGEVILLPIPDKENHFGDPIQWQQLCQEAAKTIIALLQQPDIDAVTQVVIIAQDTAFAQLPIYFAQEFERFKQNNPNFNVPVHTAWIPHSTGKIMGETKLSAESSNITRDQWETDAVQGAKKYGYHLIPIGNHMRQHLIAEFGADPSVFKPFLSGIIRDKYLHPYDEQNEIIPDLTQRGIPLDKRIVFSVGRGTQQKGHDLVIKAFAEVAQHNKDIHLVLVAPETPQGGPDYCKNLAKMIAELGVSDQVTLITTFEKLLPIYMYQYSKTEVIFLLTRISPEDLIPMESRVNTQAVLIVSNRGSNPWQVRDGVDGFVANIGSSDSETITDAVNKLTIAINLSPVARQAIAEAGTRKIATYYDALKNFTPNFIQFDDIPFEETVVLGAGATGLAYGYVAPKDKTLLIEQENFPGGICASYYCTSDSETKHAQPPLNATAIFRLENGGGHFVFGKENFSATFSLLNSVTPFKEYTKKSAVDFRDHGVTEPVPYPYQYHLAMLPRDLCAGIVNDMETSQKEPLPDNCTQEQWLKHHFGSTVGWELFPGPFHAKYLADYTGQVAALDPYKTPSDMNKVKLGANPDNKVIQSSEGYNATYQYPNEGLDALARGMAEHCRIRYQTRVTEIDPKNKVLSFADGTKMRYHHLISTLPLKTTLQLAGLSVSEPEPPHVSVLVLNIVAKKGQQCPDCDWLYIPSNTVPFHRVGFYTNVDMNFIVKAEEDPSQYVSLYVERSFKPGQRLTDQELAEYKNFVATTLKDWGYIAEGTVIVNSDTYIPYAYTPQLPGSTWVQQAQQELSNYEIEAVGRFAQWRFGGMLKSIAEGLATAIDKHPQLAAKLLGETQTLQIVSEAFGQVTALQLKSRAFANHTKVSQVVANSAVYSKNNNEGENNNNASHTPNATNS